MTHMTHILRSTSGLFIVGLLAVASADCAPRHNANEVNPPVTATPTGSNEAEASPGPVSWDDIAKSYERVRDYSCLYEKDERAISDGERQTMRLSFRKPFDVRIDWLNEQAKVDQTAVYRQGFNDGKVLAKRNGLLGALAGTLKLDPNDSLALEDSRHPITETGLGNIIDRAKRDAANAQVRSRFVAEEPLDGRSTYKFEFDAKQGAQLSGVPQATRVVIWIDKELMLPVMVEIYDRANTLLERHRFKELHTNVGLTDKTFAL